jgi:hypothetical protein
MDSYKKLSLIHYLLRFVPRDIIQDLIFGEMLDLSDQARLEVAAAVHTIHQSQVSDHVMCLWMKESSELVI